MGGKRSRFLLFDLYLFILLECSELAVGEFNTVASIDVFILLGVEEGAKRDSIYEYLKDVLPANKTEEQKLRYVGRLLVELNEEKQIDRIGLRWILKDYNRSV